MLLYMLEVGGIWEEEVEGGLPLALGLVSIEGFL